MKSRRRLLVVLVLGVAICGLVVFLLTRGEPGGGQAPGRAIAGDEAVSRASAPSTRAADPAVATIQPKPSPKEPVEVVASKPASFTGIEGRVLTDDGAPVAGARISLDRAWDAPLDRMTATQDQRRIRKPMSEAVSDGLGNFEFADLVPREYRILCEKEELTWERMTVRVIRNRAARVEIVLSRAVEIPGEVVDPDGAPVPDAEVFIGMEHVRSQTTDERGRFSVPFPSGTRSFGIVIKAFKAGVGVGSEIFRAEKLPAILRVPLLRTRMFTCRFQPDDGSPAVANARFSIMVVIYPRTFFDAGTTDASGTGTIAALPEVDRIRVALDDPTWCIPPPGGPGLGYATLGLERAVDPVGDVELTIPVTRTGSLSGTVVDRTTGKPVPGLPIQVHAHGSSPTPTGRNYQASGVTDAEGRFEFCGLQRATAAITTRSTRWLISPDGWHGQPIGPPGGFAREAFFGQYPLNQSPSVEGVVVKVVESGTVEGEVVDGSGRPVDGAEVDAGLDYGDARTQPWIDGRPYREDFTTTTDEAGRFVLRGVYPASAFKVRARRPNTPWIWSEPFDLLPGATKQEVRIVLPAGKALIVCVIGADGAMIAGADVSVTEGRPPTAGGRGPFFRERTGKDGCATFTSLTAERVTFGIDPQTLPRGFQIAEGTPNAIPMAPGEVIRFTVNLQREILVTGKLVLEDGTPLGDAAITVVPLGDTPGPDTNEHGRAAADGSFSIRVRSSRPYSIREVMTTTSVPRGGGASVDQRMEKFVPAKQQELRPGEPAVVVVRPN